MSSLYKKYPFELEKLNYDYSELEPYIGNDTVKIHHDGHQQTYVDNLNRIIAENPEYSDWTLDDFFRKEIRIPSDIRNHLLRNAGGIYNHEMYFSSITPNAPKSPEGDLAEAVVDYFDSFNNLKQQLKEAALSVFGSGYAYLVVTPQSWLQIITLPNQETPVASNFIPILTFDAWEHAYYLNYQNKRGEYFDNWWNLINWKDAEEVYAKIYEKNKKFEFDF